MCRGSGRTRRRRRQHGRLLVLRREERICQGLHQARAEFLRDSLRLTDKLSPISAFVEDCLCPLTVWPLSVQKVVCLVVAKVVGEVPKRGACQPTTSRHHLHSANTLMWLVLWRTDTLLLFTVPGALQGILGPEGKPVPRFMWGMSLPQMLRLPQILSFWGGFFRPSGKI